MNEITEHNLIFLLKEKFPKCVPFWEVYAGYFESDKDIIISQMMPFIDYVAGVIKSQDEKEIKRIFEYVEFLMLNGNDYVQAAIATGFLEGLLNYDPHEIQFIKFRQYLGKETIDYCRAWDKFTGVMTKGLHDDEKEKN